MCSYCPDPTPDELREAWNRGTPADVTPGRPRIHRVVGIEIPCGRAAVTNRIENNRIAPL